MAVKLRPYLVILTINSFVIGVCLKNGSPSEKHRYQKLIQSGFLNYLIVKSVWSCSEGVIGNLVSVSRR